MRFRRVKQENHNPFTGTEISHRARAKRLAERERIYDSFTTCRLLPARRPAMLVGDEHRASERRRHAAMRSSIGIDAPAASRGFPPVQIGRASCKERV